MSSQIKQGLGKHLIVGCVVDIGQKVKSLSGGFGHGGLYVQTTAKGIRQSVPQRQGLIIKSDADLALKAKSTTRPKS